MSSKNYLKPKHVHRERSQPSYRKKLGFLEKKKDYKKRAKNFNFKKDHLALLQRKAETKNPDEFYFAMINSSIASGSHNEHKKCLRPDEVRQMVSQDVHYLQYHQQLERKKISRLKSQIHKIQNAKNDNVKSKKTKKSKKSKNKHIYFGSDNDDLLAENKNIEFDNKMNGIADSDGMENKNKNLSGLKGLKGIMKQRKDKEKKITKALNELRGKLIRMVYSDFVY